MHADGPARGFNGRPRARLRFPAILGALAVALGCVAPGAAAQDLPPAAPQTQTASDAAGGDSPPLQSSPSPGPGDSPTHPTGAYLTPPATVSDAPAPDSQEQLSGEATPEPVDAAPAPSIGPITKPADPDVGTAPPRADAVPAPLGVELPAQTAGGASPPPEAAIGPPGAALPVAAAPAGSAAAAAGTNPRTSRHRPSRKLMPSPTSGVTVVHWRPGSPSDPGLAAASRPPSPTLRRRFHRGRPASGAVAAMDAERAPRAPAENPGRPGSGDTPCGGASPCGNGLPSSLLVMFGVMRVGASCCSNVSLSPPPLGFRRASHARVSGPASGLGARTAPPAR